MSFDSRYKLRDRIIMTVLIGFLAIGGSAIALGLFEAAVQMPTLGGAIFSVCAWGVLLIVCYFALQALWEKD